MIWIHGITTTTSSSYPEKI